MLRFLGLALSLSFGVHLYMLGLRYDNKMFWIGVGLFGAYGLVKYLEGASK